MGGIEVYTMDGRKWMIPTGRFVEHARLKPHELGSWDSLTKQRLAEAHNRLAEQVDQLEQDVTMVGDRLTDHIDRAKMTQDEMETIVRMMRALEGRLP